MKVVSLVSSGIDSPVASYMIGRFVDEMIVVHAETGGKNAADDLEVFKKLMRRLSSVCECSLRVVLIPHEKALQEFINNCTNRFTCVFCKRMLLRYAEEIANRENASAIVMGDSLGQVASQTLQNINTVEESVSVPILRPLIGFDKQEAISIARDIGTFDLSTESTGGCWAVPKTPATSARGNQLDDEESCLDIAGLVDWAISHAEVWNL